MVDQVGRRLGHAPGSARRTKPTALAAEGHQLVVPAVAAAQPQEAVGKDAAFEKGVELVLHKLRQVGTGCGLSLLKEGGGALRATGRFGATSSRQRMSLMGRVRLLSLSRPPTGLWLIPDHQDFYVSKVALTCRSLNDSEWVVPASSCRSRRAASRRSGLASRQLTHASRLPPGDET